jgi:hypothetical protein
MNIKIIVITLLIAHYNFGQNVGIGTTSPTAKLHVEGNSLVKNGSFSIDDDIGSLFFKSSNVNRAYLQMRNTNFDLKLGTIGFNTTGSVFLETNGTARMTIEPLGNVGIGTVNPTTKLQVAGSIKAEGSVTVEDGVFQMRNTTDGVNWTSILATGGNGLSVLENGISRFKFHTGGLLGIGTITPQDKLEVYDGNITQNNTNGTFRLQANSVDKGFLQLSGDDLRLGTYSSNNLGSLFFRVNGANRVEISPSGTTVMYGNAVVNGTTTLSGTTTLASKLTINEGAEAIKLNGADPAINFWKSGTQRAFLWAVENDIFLGTSVAGGKIGLNSANVETSGNIHMASGKLTHATTTTSNNLLPVCYGRVAANGNKIGGTPNFTVSKPCINGSTGCYWINSPQITSSSIIIINVDSWLVSSTSSLFATYHYQGNGDMGIYIHDEAGDPTNSNFNFVIFDP